MDLNDVTYISQCCLGLLGNDSPFYYHRMNHDRTFSSAEK